MKLESYILNLMKKKLRHRRFLWTYRSILRIVFPRKHLWVAAVEPYVFGASTLARDSVSLMSIKASFFPSKELDTRILIESTLRNHRVFHEMYVNKSSYCFGTNERSAGNKFENQHFMIFKP